MKISITYLSFSILLVVFSINSSLAVIYTSTQSGPSNVAATWGGVGTPSSTDDIVIASGHTVVAVDNVFGSSPSFRIRSITINSGSVLDNAGATAVYLIDGGIASPYSSFIINGEYTGNKVTNWADPALGLVYTALDRNLSGTGIITTTGNWQFNSSGATIALGSNLTVTNSSFTVGIVATSGCNLYCNGTITLINGNITLVPNANNLRNNSTGIITLTNGNINLQYNNTVYNYGVVTVGGNILGEAQSMGKWYNYANSILNIGGALLNTVGTGGGGNLYASYPGNIVNYNSTVNQNIKRPAGSLGINNIYHHLQCSNAATKTVAANTTINGNLTIRNNAQLDVTATSYNINIKGNWYDSSTVTNPFVEQSGLVTFSGTTPQSITANLAGGETFYNLTINNTSTGVTQVNNNITVTNTLALITGLVHTGIYETNVTNNAIAAVTSYSNASYIDGYLRRSLLSSGGIYDFPVGNTSAYELATLNFTAPHTVGDLLVNFSNLPAGSGLPLTEGTNTFATILNCGGTAPGTGNANDGVWTIAPNTSTANYDLTLNGKNYSNAGIANTILKRVDATSPWTLQGSYVASTGSEPIIANRTGYSGFSQFAIGASSLPTGISMPDTQYSNLFLIYPNPASSIVYINFDSVNTKNSTIELYDVLGNKITDAISNNNQYTINRNGLASGLYFLKITIAEKMYSQKVIFE